MYPLQNIEPFGDHLHPHIKMWREASGIVEVSDEEIRRVIAAYWALVERMDVMIGQIIAALRENGLTEDTLVVYTSDHVEHGRWWKQTFFEKSVKIMAILS